MSAAHQENPLALDQYTKRAVRAFWTDGLWDLAFVGVLLILAVWGAIYVQLIAFPSRTRPFLEGSDRNVLVWMGLALLVVVLAVYIWLAWVAVRRIKRALIFPRTGYAEHRFFMPVDRKVYLWYFAIYLSGLVLLYALFNWNKGGFSVMSVPLIMSPAAIYWGIGRIYEIRRYQWIAVIGLILATALELLLTTPADYNLGSSNFLDVLPAWGSPALPSLTWAVMIAVNGILGLASVRRSNHEA